MEVDARLNSDRETKGLVQNLLKGVMSEVSGIKENADRLIKNVQKEVKDISNDSAERAHFLSRYVDDEVIKVGQKCQKQIDNIKTLSAKLTEQFKKHLINHENMKKDMYKRFDYVEKYMPVYRAELYKMMEKAESRLLDKMKLVNDN